MASLIHYTIRKATIATWQRQVTVIDAFYMFRDLIPNVSNETVTDILDVLESVAAHKYTIEDAVEEIIDLIGG
jgi:hypothetical protein